MWLLAVAIFAACKLLTWSRCTVRASVSRQLAYLLAWPGLDADAFIGSRPVPAPSRGEWLFAAAKLVLGIGLLWFVVPRVNEPIIRGWVGLVGIAFVLHFGTFHLLSCFWRWRGFDAKPLMNWPILARSLAEFWAKRWNVAFRDLTHRFVFRPLAQRIGPRRSLAVGFLASGLVHELVITVPARGGYGGPTLYFVLQGLGLLVERHGLASRAFTLLVVLAPAYLLFPPPFIERIVLPFLTVLNTNAPLF